MNDKVISLLCGVIFSLGLVVSGMTNPSKVIGFLSITHNWDASLMFVMGGAILIFAPFFYFLKNKEVSALGMKIELPSKQDIDKKLLIGSALFGVGWGLVGLCPGPSISALTSPGISGLTMFNPIVIIFLLSMAIGIVVNKNLGVTVKTNRPVVEEAPAVEAPVEVTKEAPAEEASSDIVDIEVLQKQQIKIKIK